MPSVYVTRQLPDSILEGLSDFDVEVWDGDGPVPRQVLLEEAGAVEGLLTMLTDEVDEELLDFADTLRVVSQMAVGYDNIDLAACRERDIAVGYTPGVLTETVADLAFALLGAIVRRIPEGIEEV